MSDDSESDLDYIPSDGEAVSEEEESGDDESWLKKEEPDVLRAGLKRKRGKTPGQISQSFRKRKGGIQLQDDTDISKPVVDADNERLKEEIIEEENVAKEEKEKKRKDNLWMSFLSDVGQRPKKNAETSSQNSQSNTNSNTNTPPNKTRPPDRLSITKTYCFAGEDIEVTEKVNVSSKEGRDELKRLEGSLVSSTSANTPENASSNPSANTSENATSPATTATPTVPRKVGGLMGVLGKLDKTTKISCLDKSKMDWDVFKKKEGIEEELVTHNKGKQGYIERMDFLGRTDKRQFEIERDLRQSTRKYLP